MDTHRTDHAASLPLGFEDTRGELVIRPDVSVCTVTLQARDFLRNCLYSLAQNTRASFEIVVVDNGSFDGVADMVRDEFPRAQFIQNQANTGFTRPYNQAIQASRGRYVLLLNPDTLILPGAVDRLVAYLEEHREAGVVGPKVLNPDQTLQKPCKRGEPRPAAVFAYFTGLDRRFPNNKRLNEYLLGYLDENQTHAVAGVSGCCMLIRREVIEQIGCLDETYYAYQEDADYCRRVRDAGWQVIYHPQAQIIHFGGQGGSRIQPFRSIYAWHRSYFIYYRKYLAREYNFLFNGVYYTLMAGKLILTLGVNLFRRQKFIGGKRS